MLLPFDTVSGKLSPVDERAGDKGYGTGRFYVSYERSYGNKIMFQARTRARSTPTSQGEMAQRSKFRICVTEMETQLTTPQHFQVLMRKFRASHNATLRGFTMKECMKYFDHDTQTVVWPADYWNA